MDSLRQKWSCSKAFRIILVIAVVYTALRLAVQGVYLAWMMSPEDIEETSGQSEDVGPEIPNDLQDYLDGADNLRKRRDLYPKGELDVVEFYQYAPSYALAFIPFLWLSPVAVVIVHTLFHIVAYGLLYWLWERIFFHLRLEQATETLAWTLPVWLVFSAFWGDLGYLNIYTIMALLGTLFIDAILRERLGWSLLWLSIILQTKPQWAFAVAVPLLLGRYRFFFRLVALAVVAYLAIAGITILVVGPSYGWRQYVEYFRFLASMPENFPWRGPDAPFLGYNHSVKQTVVYLLGVSARTLQLATIVKALLLVPLGVVSLRYLFRPANGSGQQEPRLALDLAFALYLGAFIWLDMVWELSLGIAVFTYLLATQKRQGTRLWVWVVFLPYALVDLWQTLSYVLFGEDIIAPGFYILTDPSIYVPLIMIVILTFYALLIKRLWTAPMREAV